MNSVPVIHMIDKTEGYDENENPAWRFNLTGQKRRPCEYCGKQTKSGWTIELYSGDKIHYCNGHVRTVQ